MLKRLRKIRPIMTAIVLAASVTGVSVLSCADISAGEKKTAESLSVPSAGMSSVIADFCEFSQGSGVEYLSTTVLASSESVSEYITDSGEILGKYIVCSADEYAYVYESADETSKTIAKIYTNGVATLLSLDWQWCRVISDGVEGYVKTSEFFFGEVAEEHDEDTYTDIAYVTASYAYLFEEESTSSTVMYVFYAGDEVRIISEGSSSDYTLVSVDGVGEGYIRNINFEATTRRSYAVTLEAEEEAAAVIAEGVEAAAEVEEEKAEEEAARIAAEEAAAAEAAAEA